MDARMGNVAHHIRGQPVEGSPRRVKGTAKGGIEARVGHNANTNASKGTTRDRPGRQREERTEAHVRKPPITMPAAASQETANNKGFIHAKNEQKSVLSIVAETPRMLTVGGAGQFSPPPPHPS